MKIRYGLSILLLLISTGCYHDLGAQSIFDQAMKVVFLHEGNLSDHKSDRGLITRYGISLRFLQLGKMDLNNDGKIDRLDILELTKMGATKLYYQHFWQRHRIDRFVDPRVQIKLMDTAINTGFSRTARIAKKAINRISKEQILVNGVLGDSTVALINQLEPNKFLGAFRTEQADFYKALIKQTPSYDVFRNGWLKRASS